MGANIRQRNVVIRQRQKIIEENAFVTRPGKMFREQRRFVSLDQPLKAREVFAAWPNVEVEAFDGLLVDYAHRKGASVIVRGLRAISDFEYEFQMALMNRRLDPSIETVFMMPAESYSYLSSRMVKEVFRLGGEVGASLWVAQCIATAMSYCPLFGRMSASPPISFGTPISMGPDGT